MDISYEDKLLIQKFISSPIPKQKNIIEKLTLAGEINNSLYFTLLSIYSNHENLDERTIHFEKLSASEKIKKIIELRKTGQDNSDEYRDLIAKYSKDDLAKTPEDYQTHHYYYQLYVDTIAQYHSSQISFKNTYQRCTEKQKLDVINIFSIVAEDKVDKVVLNFLKSNL